jgi:hypothetical protein
MGSSSSRTSAPAPGPGERHALLLATRDLSDRPAAEIFHSYQLQRCGDAVVDLAARHAFDFEAERNVASDGTVREQGVLLEKRC